MLEIRVPRWLKQCLTVIQIVQFVVGLLAAISHMFLSYTVSGGVVTCMNTSGQMFSLCMNILYLIPLMLLFLQFFVKRYLGNTPRKKNMQANQRADTQVPTSKDGPKDGEKKNFH